MQPEFFPGARLNFAQNLLYPSCNPKEDAVAVIEANEVSRRTITWHDLRERVRECSVSMTASGIGGGDRVAGYVGNHLNALVAMLSATSLGAIWSGISPDAGVSTVLDRLQQISPKLLFADNAVIYSSKTHVNQDKIRRIIAGLPALEMLILFDTVPGCSVDLGLSSGDRLQFWRFSEFLAAMTNGRPLAFAQLLADHPVYILYSSGTTGKPKCIVHGAIGTLIQHKKEHDIQCSMKPGDRLFYFTTCSWMMWQWLVSALATGVTIVLYDGSPFRPLDANGKGEIAMARLIEDLRISHFGTSAKYLSILQSQGVVPKSEADLSTLKAIYSTGSPLAPSTFTYVYHCFGEDINLASITGGTDIVSLFGSPSQISPVYEGEIQVRALGMAVEVFDASGQTVSDEGEPGDLVCTKPFPCQPVMFWGPDGHEKYWQSYFDTFPGVWHHGDFVRINKSTGGMIMLGRSDGVLKPAGVRFGTSEIYNVLSQHFQQIIEDGLCIGRRRICDSDETVILFVKMRPNKPLSEKLKASIAQMIKSELSARHVPAIIDETPEIPVTTNGKKIEVAVKQILCGTNIKISAAVANPKCLDWYKNWHACH